MGIEVSNTIVQGLLNTKGVYDEETELHLPDVDFYYGPYESKEAAWEKLSADEMNVLGRTVGVIVDGEIKEYWFKSGTGETDLIEKASGEGGSVDTSNLLPKSEAEATYAKKSDVYAKGDVDSKIGNTSELNVTEENKNLTAAVNIALQKSGIEDVDGDSTYLTKYVRQKNKWVDLTEIIGFSNAFSSLAKDANYNAGIKYDLKNNKGTTSSIEIPYATTKMMSGGNKTYSGGLMTNDQYERYESYEPSINSLGGDVVNLYDIASGHVKGITIADGDFKKGFKLVDDNDGDKGTWSVDVAHKDSNTGYVGGLLSNDDYKAFCEAVEALDSKQGELKYYSEDDSIVTIGKDMSNGFYFSTDGSGFGSSMHHYGENGGYYGGQVDATIYGNEFHLNFQGNGEDGRNSSYIRSDMSGFEINYEAGNPIFGEENNFGSIKIDSEGISIKNRVTELLIGKRGVYVNGYEYFGERNDGQFTTEAVVDSKLASYTYSKSEIDDKDAGIRTDIYLANQEISLVKDKIGDVTNLQTPIKTDVVSAINEVYSIKPEVIGENLVDGTSNSLTFDLSKISPAGELKVIETPYSLSGRGAEIKSSSYVSFKLDITNPPADTEISEDAYISLVNTQGKAITIFKLTGADIKTGKTYKTRLINNVSNTGTFVNGKLQIKVRGVKAGKYTISSLKVENSEASTNWCASVGDGVVDFDPSQYLTRAEANDMYVSEDGDWVNICNHVDSLIESTANMAAWQAAVEPTLSKIPTTYKEVYGVTTDDEGNEAKELKAVTNGVVGIISQTFDYENNTYSTQCSAEGISNALSMSVDGIWVYSGKNVDICSEGKVLLGNYHNGDVNVYQSIDAENESITIFCDNKGSNNYIEIGKEGIDIASEKTVSIQGHDIGTLGNSVGLNEYQFELKMPVINPFNVGDFVVKDGYLYRINTMFEIENDRYVWDFSNVDKVDIIGLLKKLLDAVNV